MRPSRLAMFVIMRPCATRFPATEKTPNNKAAYTRKAVQSFPSSVKKEVLLERCPNHDEKSTRVRVMSPRQNGKIERQICDASHVLGMQKTVHKNREPPTSEPFWLTTHRELIKTNLAIFNARHSDSLGESNREFKYRKT